MQVGFLLAPLLKNTVVCGVQFYPHFLVATCCWFSCWTCLHTWVWEENDITFTGYAPYLQVPCVLFVPMPASGCLPGSFQFCWRKLHLLYLPFRSARRYRAVWRRYLPPGLHHLLLFVRFILFGSRSFFATYSQLPFWFLPPPDFNYLHTLFTPYNG